MFCKTCGKEMNDNQIICLNCGCAVGSGNSFCANCGGEIMQNSIACLKCGVSVTYGSTKNNLHSNFNSSANNLNPYNVSEKSWVITLLLCIFLGELGVHRFYSGKIGTGILWLITVGCFGIGWIVDIIMIACKKYRDGYGNIICNN